MKELNRLATLADRGTIITILYHGKVRSFLFDTTNTVDALEELWYEFYPTIAGDVDNDVFPMEVMRLWEVDGELWYDNNFMLFCACFMHYYFDKSRWDWVNGGLVEQLIALGKDYRIKSEDFKKAA